VSPGFVSVSGCGAPMYNPARRYRSGFSESSMAVIAELAVPPKGFPLGELLTIDPTLYIDFEKVVPVGEAVLPLFWVWNGNLDAFERRIRDNEFVIDLQLIDRTVDRTLYAIEWSLPPDTFFESLVKTNATILDAKGHGNHDWRFRLLFPSHKQLSEFHTLSQENDTPLTLGRVYTVRDMGAGLDNVTLSQKQREALELAFRHGYFDTPRTVTLEELAAEFDISSQALSDRLRRGTKAIVEQVVGFPHESR
jgi:predicted DNA binding protein